MIATKFADEWLSAPDSAAPVRGHSECRSECHTAPSASPSGKRHMAEGHEDYEGVDLNKVEADDLEELMLDDGRSVDGPVPFARQRATGLLSGQLGRG